MNQIQEVAEKVREAVLSGKWDQAKGTYVKEGSCCVGAKLACALDVAEGSDQDYIKGADAFAEAIGGTRVHVILLLRQAGAGHNPLSSSEWPKSREEVWGNLMQIEELPDLSGADLSGADLSGADLWEPT